jgi:hypothetical protein
MNSINSVPFRRLLLANSYNYTRSKFNANNQITLAKRHFTSETGADNANWKYEIGMGLMFGGIFAGLWANFAINQFRTIESFDHRVADAKKQRA